VPPTEGRHMSDDRDEDIACPLCLEELDITDRHFKPCQCGYQMCRFCWNHIMENINGRCPQCREPYDSQNYTFTPPDPKELAKAHQDKRKKERRNKKQDNVNSRKQLSNVRVIQRNLVYVTNLALCIAKEELLRKFEYFGQYGKIEKIVINKNNHYNIHSPHGPSVSAYITFCRRDDALACIKAVDGAWVENRILRGSFGTTKYCTYFLRNLPCNNPECMYLHELGSDEDSFTKEDIAMGKHHFHDQTHPNTILQAPPEDDCRFTILPKRPVVVHLEPGTRQPISRDEGDRGQYDGLRQSMPAKMVHDHDGGRGTSGLNKSSDSISSIPLEKPILPASASWATKGVVQKAAEPEEKGRKTKAEEQAGAKGAKAAGGKAAKAAKQPKAKTKAAKAAAKAKTKAGGAPVGGVAPASAAQQREAARQQQQQQQQQLQQQQQQQQLLQKHAKGGKAGTKGKKSASQTNAPPGVGGGWGGSGANGGGGGGGSGTAPDKGNVFDASGGFSAWNPDKQGGRAKEQAEWSGDVPSGWGSSAPTGGAGTSSKAGASSQGGGQGGQGGGQGGPASNRKGRAGAGGKVEEDSNDFGFDPWQEMQRGFAELLVDAPSKEQDAGPSYGAWPGRKEHGRQPTQAQVAAAAGTGPGGRSRYDFAQDLSASGGGSSGGASANGGGSNGGSGGGPAANSDPEELHNAFRKLLPNVNVRFVETDGSSAAAKPSASNSEGASGVGSSASSVYGRQQAMPAVPPPPGIKWAGSQAQRPSYAMGSSWSPTGPYGGSSGGGGGQKGPPGLGTQPPPQWGQMAAPAMQRGGQAMPQFPPGIQRFSAQMSGQFPSHSTGAGDAYLQQKGWSTQPKIRPGTSQPYRQEPPHGHPMPSQSSASAALRDPAIVSAGAAGKSAWGDGRTPLPGNRLPPTAGYDYKRAYGQRPPGQQLPPGINPNAMPRRPAGPVQYSNYGPPGVARPPAKGPPPGLSKPQDPVSAQHQAQLYQQHQQRMASSASSSGMDGQQPQRQ